jgi:tRNA (Thr-GGU) A37 N-methylase
VGRLRHPSRALASVPSSRRPSSPDGLDLHVTDLDVIDGSPVFDLGPYFREMGPRGEVREPCWPGEMLESYWGDTASGT